MGTKFLVVDTKVLPEIFTKVIETKDLLRTGESKNIQQAVKQIGISRSAFYKYKDSVFPFYEKNKTKVVTIAFLLRHESGILSKVLDTIANAKGNILTINQNIPNHGVANVTISFETDELDQSGEEILDSLYSLKGVKNIQIIGRE
jgi:chorismate mutase